MIPLKKREEKKDKVKTNRKESELVTKESFSAVCALFAALALLIVCTGGLIFGEIGVSVCAFLTGVFGYTTYPLLLATLYLSVTSLIGKRLVKNRKAGTCIVCALVCVLLLIHTVTTTFPWETQKVDYLANIFKMGEQFPVVTVAGWFGGLIVFAIASATTNIGAIIVFSALIVFFAYLAFVFAKKRGETAAKEVKTEQSAPVVPNAPVEIPLSSEPTQPQFTKAQAIEPQNNYAPQNVNPYAANLYMQEAIQQRPGVSLPDEGQAVSKDAKPVQEKSGGAFSPFGTAQSMRNLQAEEQNTYNNSREFLFGASPAENYQRNLIFDPNASVNKRPPVDPTQVPPINSGFAPSYSDAYQSSVNAGTVDRPTKIFTDRSNDTYSLNTYETKRETPIEPIAPISPQPVRPVEPMPTIPEQPVSYPTFETRTAREESVESVERIERVERVEIEDRETRSFEISPRQEEETGAGTPITNDEYRRHDYMDLFSPSNPNVYGNDGVGRQFSEEFTRRETERETLDIPESRESIEPIREDPRIFEEERGNNRAGIDIFDEDEEEENPYALRSDFDESRGGRDFDTSRGFEEKSRESVAPKTSEPASNPAPTPPPKPRIIRPYARPNIDDFDCRDVEPSQNFQEMEETKENIIATLEDFNITGATIASVTNGPTVTRYNVALPRSVKPQKVVALDQSIALSLHSSGVNIYPNYEDGVVSIEVPNKDRQFVQLGCMLTGDTFVNAKPSSLMFAMGKDVGNRKIYGDISKMIHLLVAGSSGSGKSVFLGSLIVSMIYKYSPEELRLILIDPKKTEFVLYNNLPHLMINEIITDVNKAVQSLNWAIGEMNRRYTLFEQMSRSGTYVVNLDGYNSHLENKADRLPKIVIIIDELADLMLAAKKEIEDRIQNLTQKARAAGIHLIVATQRPSTDVITGVIKSNLATRIAFAVATDVDSRVILDQSGAQNLLGKGDFLYTMQGINTPVRVQSAFISSEDSQRVVNYIKANNEAYYDETATAYINNTRSGGDGGSGFGGGGDEIEPVYIDALRYVILSGSASISMIQRKCSVGYNKAGKIVEWMEDMGYISSFDGAKARKVLITKEEFESKYGSL